jgi:predicted nucleic acid-binding protein
LNGHAPTSVEDELARGALATTAITAYELRRGARTEKALRSVELLLAQVAEIVPFDDAAAGEAAAVYRELSRSGQVIGKADLYISGSDRQDRGGRDLAPADDNHRRDG